VKADTYTFEFPFQFRDKEVTMSSVEVEEAEYSAYASAMGIVRTKQAVPSSDGKRMVRIDASGSGRQDYAAGTRSREAAAQARSPSPT
jgi:hypothetical protein